MYYYKDSPSYQDPMSVDSEDSDRKVSTKRPFSEGGEEGMEEGVKGEGGEENSQTCKKKKDEELGGNDVTMTSSTSSAATIGSSHDMNFPLPDEKGTSCLVKVQCI